MERQRGVLPELPAGVAPRTAIALAALVAALAQPLPGHAAERFHGVYAGAQGGWGSTDADLSGAAGAQRLDGAALSGPTAALVIGSSTTTRGGLFVAVEAHAATMDQTFRQTRSGDAALRLSANRNWGLSARLGRTVGRGAVVYGVLGWQDTRMELEQRTDAGNRTVDGTVRGVRGGVGTELATAEGNFLRFEYSVTAHDTETFETDDQAFELDPLAQQLTVTVGFRF